MIVAYIDTFGFTRSLKQDVWGQFGDFFGGILNPIISGCAFFGLIATLKGQAAESKRLEVRHRAQTDDARFFQLLSLLAKSSENFNFTLAKGGWKIGGEGRAGFQHAWNSFYSGLAAAAELHGSPVVVIDQMKNIFGPWRDQHWEMIGPHFQTLYAVVEFVSKSGSFGSEHVEFYMALLKAQLSEGERLIAYYLAMLSKEDILIALAMNASKFNQVSAGKDPLAERADALIQAAMVVSHD